MIVLNNEEREFLNILRERNAYRDTLVEIMYEELPKLLEVQTRLHSGSDAMRDEGHKLWLVCSRLKNLLGGFQCEEVLVNSDGKEIGGVQ